MSLDHLLLHIATYAKDPISEKSFPDTVYHKPVAASAIYFFEDEGAVAVDTTNLIVKNVDSEAGLVERLLAYVTTREPGNLVTFFGHGFVLPVLYYRCLINRIDGRALFHPDTGFYPRYSPRHVEMTNVFTNHGAIQVKKIDEYLKRFLGIPERPKYSVTELADTGKWSRIKANLAVDTFCMALLFIRHAVVTGLITADDEDEVTAALIEVCGSRSKAVASFASQIFEDAEE